MNGIGAAALEVQTYLEEAGHEFCIIGGLAVVFWGTPRSTQDVDFSLLVDLGDERRVATDLINEFESRVAEPVDFALRSNMVLVRASNGTPIDIALASFPLEQAMITRSQHQEIQPGLKLRLLTPEDLIITKAIAGRAQDQLDIRGIVDRQSGGLARERILADLGTFCELLEVSDPLDLVQSIFDE